MAVNRHGVAYLEDPVAVYLGLAPVPVVFLGLAGERCHLWENASEGLHQREGDELQEAKLVAG
eukprot:scaffold454465_cov27-Prasinocladus_malaysianus.AAC.1